MIFLVFLCTFDGKILVHYLVMIQDDSCLVVSQNYQYISSTFPPCLSEHPSTVMKKYAVIWQHKHKKIASTIQNIVSLRTILLHVTSCPQTMFRAAVIETVYALLELKFTICIAAAILSHCRWKQKFLHSNMCSHEHIKLIYTSESRCSDISSQECHWDSMCLS